MQKALEPRVSVQAITTSESETSPSTASSFTPEPMSDTEPILEAINSSPLGQQLCDSVRELEREFSRAKERYRAALPGTGPWPLDGIYSPAVYESWQRSCSSKWKASYDYGSGQVVLYGDPSTWHERVAALITSVIQEALIEALSAEDLDHHCPAWKSLTGKERFWLLLSQMPSPAYKTQHPARGAKPKTKEPDGSYVLNEAYRSAFVSESNEPSQSLGIVVEHAFANENESQLLYEVTEWQYSTLDRARIALGVKTVAKLKNEDGLPYLYITLQRSPPTRHGCHSAYTIIPFGAFSHVQPKPFLVRKATYPNPLPLEEIPISHPWITVEQSCSIPVGQVFLDLDRESFASLTTINFSDQYYDRLCSTKTELDLGMLQTSLLSSLLSRDIVKELEEMAKAEEEAAPAGYPPVDEGYEGGVEEGDAD